MEKLLILLSAIQFLDSLNTVVQLVQFSVFKITQYIQKFNHVKIHLLFYKQ